MTNSPLMMDKGGSRRQAAPKVASDVLGVLGIALGVLGGSDLVLIFIPASWGNSEWEFGTLVAVMDGLPITVLAFALVLFAGVARDRTGLVRVLGWVAVVLGAVFLVGGIVILARTLGPALASPTDPLLRLGVRKAVAKLIVQVAISPAAMFLVGWSALKKVSSAATR